MSSAIMFAEQRPCLGKLSEEVIVMILRDNGLSTRDIAAFARTGKRYQPVATSVLYMKNIRDEGGIAVLWAVYNQRIRMLARLVDYGANINRSFEPASLLSGTRLYKWVRTIASSVLKDYSLLYSNYVWAYRTYTAPYSHHFSIRPLALAARLGLTRTASWLLDNGASQSALSHGLCDCEEKKYTSPGMWRAWPQQTLVSPPPCRWTALHFAIHHGHQDLARLLMRRGANTLRVNGDPSDPCTALHSAALQKEHAIVTDILLLGAVEVDERGCGGAAILHLGICQSDDKLVDIAIRYGADVNLEYNVDGNPWTPLAMAIAAGDMDLALRLLKKGAKTDFILRKPPNETLTVSGLLDLQRDEMCHIAFSDIPDTVFREQWQKLEDFTNEVFHLPQNH